MMKHEARTLTDRISRPVSCEYLLSLPQGALGGGQDYPLLVFLHGAGERGNNVQMVRKHGPHDYADRHEDFPFILVSPLCPHDLWWNNDTVMALVNEIVTHHPVDEQRIYLTGLSMGGFGSWSLGIEYPERWAAIAPICGGGYPYMASRLKDIPIWAFHGAKDHVVPLYESKRMVEAVHHAGGHVRFTVYPDADHDAWTETYDNPELYAWFLEHRRNCARPQNRT